MPEWISIETDQPRKGEIFLVSCVGGIVRIAEYRGNDWWVTVPGGWNLYVLAWQPLPAAYSPAEVANA